MIAILTHKTTKATKVLLFSDFLTFNYKDTQRLEAAGWEVVLHAYSYAHKPEDAHKWVNDLLAPTDVVKVGE